ncbi:MAG: DUF3552 domain-containing protein [Synergistales bacterium]|nr:DUF3552 domain-containing protein [Synergistales bacterium]
MNFLTAMVAFVVGIAAGTGAGFLLSKTIGARNLESAKAQSRNILREAQVAAEQIKREKLTEAKEEIFRLRQEIEKEGKERRNELQRAERRLEQKEENLDRKLDRVAHREEELKGRQDELEARLLEVEETKRKQMERLEEIAGMTRETARDLLLRQTEEDAQHVLGLRLKELEEKAKREAERKAREIIVTAVQRCAVEHTSEAAVSVVHLPSDEMKGRIIGREGRNIRTFETLAGVDLIVDDTPEAVKRSRTCTQQLPKPISSACN